MKELRLERYCARCARENKQIKPEYLKDHGSPTFHPKKTTLCPKHGIAMPLTLKVGEDATINLVSLSNETHDMIEAFVNAINRQSKLMDVLEKQLTESENRMNDLQNAITVNATDVVTLFKDVTTRKKPP